MVTKFVRQTICFGLLCIVLGFCMIAVAIWLETPGTEDYYVFLVFGVFVILAGILYLWDQLS